MLLTPDRARESVGKLYPPYSPSDVLAKLGWKFEVALGLPTGKFAQSFPALKLIRFTPGSLFSVREIIAHELGHYGWQHGNGRFCGFSPWSSLEPCEREAHWYSEEFLLPLADCEQFIELGGPPRITFTADWFKVTVPFLRRRLERSGLIEYVWDDADISPPRPSGELPFADPLLA